MVAFNAKWGAVAAATVALGALGTAGPALADSPVPLYGSGSSLQANAQNNIWGPGWSSHSALSGTFSLTYTATSSGSGLNEFGNNTGTLDPTQDSGAPAIGSSRLLDAFVGTDDAPNTTQLSNAATASGGASELTIPVAQTAVAVVVSLPVGLTLPSGTTNLKLPNAYLNEAILRTIPAYTDSSESHTYAAGTWGALLGALYGNSFGDTLAGSTYAGDKTITTEVRVGVSGTSYVFKNFLNQIDSTDWSSFANGNESWPSSVAASDNSGANTGGGALANSVKSTPGTIGYVAVSDAVGKGFTNTVQTASDGHQYLYAELQDNGTGLSGIKYADPLRIPSTPTTNPGGANVDPNGVSWTGIPTAGVPAEDSWSAVIASDPNIYTNTGQTSYYPIAAATYDLAWTNYETSTLTGYYTAGGYSNPKESVADYLTWVTSAAGQNAIYHTGFYEPLPNTSTVPVLADAQGGVTHIG